MYKQMYNLTEFKWIRINKYGDSICTKISFKHVYLSKTPSFSRSQNDVHGPTSVFPLYILEN